MCLKSSCLRIPAICLIICVLNFCISDIYVKSASTYDVTLISEILEPDLVMFIWKSQFSFMFTDYIYNSRLFYVAFKHFRLVNMFFDFHMNFCKAETFLKLAKLPLYIYIPAMVYFLNSKIFFGVFSLPFWGLVFNLMLCLVVLDFIYFHNVTYLLSCRVTDFGNWNLHKYDCEQQGHILQKKKNVFICNVYNTPSYVLSASFFHKSSVMWYLFCQEISFLSFHKIF